MVFYSKLMSRIHIIACLLALYKRADPKNLRARPQSLIHTLEHAEKPYLLLSFDYAQDGEPVEPQFQNFGCPSTTLGTVSEVEPQIIQCSSTYTMYMLPHTSLFSLEILKFRDEGGFPHMLYSFT